MNCEQRAEKWVSQVEHRWYYFVAVIIACMVADVLVLTRICQFRVHLNTIDKEVARVLWSSASAVIAIIMTIFVCYAIVLLYLRRAPSVEMLLAAVVAVCVFGFNNIIIIGF